jgi:broad specificity phosphatase PhoE
MHLRVEMKEARASHTYRKGLWWTLAGWIYVLFIYLRVDVHFIRWRLQFWHQLIDATESTRIRMKQTLLLIRHGQTTWNVEHRLPGQVPGVVLNDTGRQQVARLAEALSVIPISAIISSPLQRAYDTAAIIAQGRNLTIECEPDLMDTDVGRWTGRIIEEVAKNDPDWRAYVRNPTVAPEGIETFPQVQQRVIAAIERWRAQEQVGAYPAFVAHADIIKVLIAHYTGLEVGRAGTLAIDNASVSIVELEDEQRPRVVAVGWSPHPGWLKPPLPQILKGEGGVAQENEQKAKSV